MFIPCARRALYPPADTVPALFTTPTGRHVTLELMRAVARLIDKYKTLTPPDSAARGFFSSLSRGLFDNKEFRLLLLFAIARPDVEKWAGQERSVE